MRKRLQVAAAVLAAVCVASAYGQAGSANPPAKKHHAAKKVEPPKPKGPTIEEQIQALRQQMQSQQGQIDSLKTDLADKDAQLKQAQQAAADAQAAATQAQQAAASGQQALTANTAAVTTLQSTVTDLKANAVSLASTVSDETSAVKKAIENPSALHYKGITLSPQNSYLAGETVYRTKATGGDIPTAFSAIPYEGADAYSLSEFYGSARQSRAALMAEGKTSWGRLRGYYEADWLGAGITSNNNQSNSYVMRERVLWGEAQTNSGWAFDGGQMWSLATENGKGITPESPNELTPQTIDPNYVAGFVWTRQYGFRLVKSSNHAAFGISAENAQLLYTASLAGNTPYAVLGSAGNNGGNYNAAISASATTTYVQNYINEPGTTTYLPVYNTVVANTNIANLSFNAAPDIIAKFALDPGWGHYELIGIGRFAHETIYPGVTTDATKYGGQTDIETGAAVVAKATTAGSYSNSIVLGGFGGSFRVPLVLSDPTKLKIGGKVMYGSGIGRYGDTTLSDVTTNASGEFSPLKNFSGLGTLEANPTPRLMIYLNYGGDYAGRDDWANAGATTLGSPSATFCPTGFTSPSQCTSKPNAALLAGGGSWGGHWGAPSAAALGYGSRVLSNSSCNSLASPGFSGGSTGYYPGGSCGAQTRDVQEVTGGYWYDIYKGDRGRLRQSFQYGYAVREGWSGAGGIRAKGIDNMFWTSFRYYLP